jgi:hypothetical protein
MKPQMTHDKAPNAESAARSGAPDGAKCVSLSPAPWRQAALTRGAIVVPGHRVVQVAPGRGPGTARRGTRRAAGPHQVLQLAAGVVADLGVGVVAGTAGEGDQRCGEARSGARRPGARRPGAGQGVRGVAAGQAGVGGGGAVGVQGRDAPTGARVPSSGGSQVPGLIAVQHAEPVSPSGGLGPAQIGRPGNGDGDQRRQARPRGWAGTGTGTGTARAADSALATPVVWATRAVRPGGAGRVRCPVIWWKLVQRRPVTLGRPVVW